MMLGSSFMCVLVSLLVVNGQRPESPNTGNDYLGDIPNATKEQSCTTPKGAQGTCTFLSDCQAFSTLFKKGPNNEVIRYLRKGICHYERESPVVCCPLENSGNGYEWETTPTVDSNTFEPNRQLQFPDIDKHLSPEEDINGTLPATPIPIHFRVKELSPNNDLPLMSSGMAVQTLFIMNLLICTLVLLNIV